MKLPSIFFFIIILTLSCVNNNKESTSNDRILLQKKIFQQKVLTERMKNNNNQSEHSSTNSSSISSINSKIDINGSNLFTVIVENAGFIDFEIPKYTVKIQRTADLNNKHLYDSPREKTHTSGFFGSDAVFYDATYGYYTVEYFGYDNYDKKVFHRKFNNVIHKCNTIGTFYTNTDWNSPSVYCY